ncbi:substrate-binding domain-containing protein [Piscinibacter koreensis]|uniref:Quinoprotein dehydrogenase-associated putative ABC transporter substrate-binding protein n=1 Tax=Piscinibacter koreensis TaxID=2742824 RepID=A0A7Y6NPA7_9BURK|nr:substrate-binding domain-containing protein [Schlegelella koreensis]NUZ06757.1 quinoprotein dehydrogenase-associated putative ABC transporter substrate-binding protein [Schlegelella koreensis]
MSSRCPDALGRVLALAVACAAALSAPGARAADAPAADAPAAAASDGAPQPARLRVCADPDNLPFSRADRSGFENRIAQMIADDLGWRLEYAWLPQVRGFVRKSIGAGLCDVFIGVPAGFDRVLTTRPYYRSGYVFVNRADAREALASFDDPRLARLRIGVQLIGDDAAATPPGHALARHGALERVVGYPVFGEGPAAQRAVDDLAAGRLDAALLWGPQAGYFAARSSVPMRLAPAQAPADVALPFEFSIAMGVRKGDRALRQRLDDALERRAAEIAAILDDFAVPRRPFRASTTAAAAGGEEHRP